MSGARRGRANGEGSIYPYKNGYAAYVWVTTPGGQKKRKYVYGKTRDEVYDKWVQLKAKAAKMPIPTTTPTVAEYLAYWLAEVISPNREDNTYSHYELMSRLHIIPGIGNRRIDKLTVRETQAWLNKLPGICQCCVQGKDAKRKQPRCCAIGECCADYPSRRVIEAARGALRAALNHAIREELISRNVAELVKLPKARKKLRRRSSWTVDEARKFLESSRNDDDPLYPLWVLILVLGLRKGEALGLVWPDDDGDWLSSDEKCICGETHTLVLMTRNGRPIEPRNINRSFDIRCARAGVRRITIHDTRRTCGSLLATLEVHPRVAMQILRHSRIALTMEIYTLVPDEVTRAALKRLGDELSQHDHDGDG